MSWIYVFEMLLHIEFFDLWIFLTDILSITHVYSRRGGGDKALYNS